MSGARLAAGTTLSINDELIGDLTYINAVGGGNAEIIAVTTHDSVQRYGEGLQGLRSFGELQFAGAASSVETFSTMEFVQFTVQYPGQTAWRGAGFITGVVTGAAIDEMIPYAITARICIICSGVVEAAYTAAEHPYLEYVGVFGDLSTGDITSWLWTFGDNHGLYYEAHEGGVTGYYIDDVVQWRLDDTQGRGDTYSSATIPEEILHEYHEDTYGSGKWLVSGAGDDSYNGTYIEDGTYNLYPVYKKAGGTEETYTTTLTVSDLCGSDIDTHDITVGSESEERWIWYLGGGPPFEGFWHMSPDIGFDLFVYHTLSTLLPGNPWTAISGAAPTVEEA